MSESVLLSVCMIVKNEAEVLADCLSQVVRFSDELIIVDTGSTDATKEIAGRYTQKVYDFTWCDDFSAARNYAYSLGQGDYLMWVDADHLIDEKAVQQLIDLKKDLHGDVNSVIIGMDTPENGGILISYHMIMKRDGIRHWHGVIHERYPVAQRVLYPDIVFRHRKPGYRQINLKCFTYSKYILNLKDEEFKETFWLGLQCCVDLTLARETEEARRILAIALSTKPPIEELLRMCLLSGNNFRYWGRERDALRMYELFLQYVSCDDSTAGDSTENLSDLLKAVCAVPENAYMLHQLLMRAQKLSYRLGQTEQSIHYNALVLNCFPESVAAKANQTWFARFRPVTVSVCLIVKDEEPVLERCLKNAIQFADELIVADTGSADRTREIAARYTDQVYDYVWQDDFAAARNYAYSKAHCDYIMWLDADDDMEKEDIARLLYLKNHMPPNTDVVLFTYMCDRSSKDPYSSNELVRDRLIRRECNPLWHFPIHEAIPIDQNWNCLIRPDICIFHRKVHVNEEGRNLRIFETKRKEGFQMNEFNLSYYCRELYMAGDCEGAVRIFDKLWQSEHLQEINYAMFFYIESMKHLKQYAELKNILSEYLEHYGLNEMVLCCLGDLYRRDGEYDKALRNYRICISMEPDIRDGRIHMPAYHEFFPWMGLAKISMKSQTQREAAKALRKAEQFCPENMELKMLNLALSCLEQG